MTLRILNFNCTVSYTYIVESTVGLIHNQLWGRGAVRVSEFRNRTSAHPRTHVCLRLNLRMTIIDLETQEPTVHRWSVALHVTGLKFELDRRCKTSLCWSGIWDALNLPVVAALLVEKNPQMPPCRYTGGITGRKKFANAAVVYYR